MELQERVDEVLETLWILIHEEDRGTVPLQELGQADRVEVVPLLASSGLATIEDGLLRLTPEGETQAVGTVRRHRLAERLLVDVLNGGGTQMEGRACRFEHFLDRGLEENICTLLGHPKLCPHGKPIPPGRCCRSGERQPRKVVAPLAELSPGQRGKVAYIYAPESAHLNKLMSMGVLPGVPVVLLQSFPSYVFQAGNAQFAVDRSIASAIYVRLEEAEEKQAAPAATGRKRRWRLGGRG